MASLRGHALIGQSGGPTAVINQSLVGLVERCVEHRDITGVYGALNGIQGIMDERLIDLGREAREELEKVAHTPAAALGSVRRKPTPEAADRILQVFEAHDIRYFFYVGGNDSAETAHLLNEAAIAKGYEVRLFHVPKTIDNDLACCDHTPGYGSAARFVAQAFMGDDQDNRSLGGVKINVVMGRHAGWLTAASRLARRHEDDGPHLIYLPEATFDRDGFCDSVEEMLHRHGRCLVAVSEGIHDAQGNHIAKGSEVDSHGNVQLSGTGALGDYLSNLVKTKVSAASRVRADTFGYLQRSFFGVVSEQDALEAREVGRAAVDVATSGDVTHGSLGIQRGDDGGSYQPVYAVNKLEDVAAATRLVPKEFMNGTNDVTEAFVEWATPIVGTLPQPGRLASHPVTRRL
ncbi:6-phosphofructokinase 1 [Planctomycetes bacterium Poly30]|uniref:Pyrophosphate--fructose 6-phosphate 1-phosphotransferase n=1 Tax=Saltatorellus ferox TaxID=2528018 RepID=A0A518EXY7_9BACT|nr:6-phosphofructokinase 1 [Planctomycetes bacterium Poly30]